MIQRNITSFFTKSNTKSTSEIDDQSTNIENGDQSASTKRKRKRGDSPNSLTNVRSGASKQLLNTTKNKEEKTKSPNSVQQKKKNKTSLNTETKHIKKEQTLSLWTTPSKDRKDDNTLKDTLNLDTELESTSNDSAEESDSSELCKSTQLKAQRKVTQLNYSSEEEEKGGEEKKPSIDLKKATNNKTENISDKDKESFVQSESNSEDEKKEENLTEIKSSKENKNKILRFFAPKQTTNDTQDKEKAHCYNPSASNYDPVNDASWKKDEMVPYIALTRTLELIEEISARLKIIEILSNYFRSVIVLSPSNLLPSIYLCLNQLAPPYEGIMLGVAETNLMKAIAQCTGRTIAQLKADVQNVGDIGLVAEGSRCNQRTMFQPPPLTVSHVYNSLKEIAQMTGHASLSRKLNKIQTLFVACRFTEARYLIRSLAGKLRVGLAEQSVLQALALACTMTPPEERHKPVLDVSRNMSKESFKQKYDENALLLKTTYCECPNYDLIIPVLLDKGIKTLPQTCKITPGIPIKPMLAQPTKGIQEILTRFEGLKFTCEWKYDGERAQIHVKDDGDAKIYSRNQENNTSKYPDIIRRLKNVQRESVKNCIFDCEAVAWDTEKKQILPFQVLSTRKRKDAIEADIKVQVCVFMFDLLYLNDESLVKRPFIERRKLLKENFIEVPGEWQFATSLDTSKMEEVQEFLDESVKGNCEGLMIKTLEEDATYEIAKRSRNWLKLKKDYLDGVGDTLDTVVIGGYIGKGKRTGAYGGFLLACYDSENEEYQSLCKIGTGFSEDDLQKHAELLKQHIIPQPKPYYRYDPSHVPDHWFECVQVWEIKCADLSLSPVYRAAIGIVDPEKGISLRFPRFVRVRDDKNCEDATSAQQIAQMYKNQEQIQNQNTDIKGNEEDFY